MLTFVWNYIFRLGFLDGREGLLLHLYHSAYISWKYAKAWQIGRSRVEHHENHLSARMIPIEVGRGVRRDVGSRVDLAAILRVVLVGANHHLFVGDGWRPAQLRADARSVEDEAFGDHAVVVGAERRQIQLVGELHRGDGRPLWQRSDARPAPGSLDDRFVDVAQRDDVVRADVEEIGAVVRQRLQAGRREVLRVDELIAIAAVADDPDFLAVVDELEENGEQAKAAAVDDGGAADRDDVEVVRVVGEHLFAGELGAAVELDWVWRLIFGDVVAEVAGPEAVAGDEDELADAELLCGLGEVARAVDV